MNPEELQHDKAHDDMMETGSGHPLSLQVPQYDDNDPVFPDVPDGPTYGQVNEWKSRYGEGEVFAVRIDQQPFVFRTLTRAEYKEILKTQNADPMWREERTVEKCLLWPAYYKGTAISMGRAGIPTVLAEQIMECSGFSLSSEVIPL